jgi:hypothetical protein
MNFQNVDQNLLTYNDLFEKKQSAFVPKPDELLYIPTMINIPPPISRALNYVTSRVSNGLGNPSI